MVLFKIPQYYTYVPVKFFFLFLRINNFLTQSFYTEIFFKKLKNVFDRYRRRRLGSVGKGVSGGILMGQRIYPLNRTMRQC